MGIAAGYGAVLGGGTTTPGTTVTQDHIFPSTQARDDYFTLNATRLSELITGTPIIVTISGTPRFQTWGAETPTQISDYSATNWTTEDAIDGARILTLLNAISNIRVQTREQSDTTNSVSGLTVDRLPVATATGLSDSAARYVGGNLFVPGQPGFEATGFDVGELLRLSESAGFLSYISGLDSIRRTLIGFRTPPTAASSRPRRLALTQAERQVDIQANLSGSFTEAEVTQRYTIPDQGRINAIQLFSTTAITNLRIRINNISPGTAGTVKYIPNRQAWLDGAGGLDFTPGGELRIRIDDSPLFSGPNQVYELTIRKGSGTLQGTTAAGPAFVIRMQNGTLTELADLNDVSDRLTQLVDTPTAAGTDGQILQWMAGNLINTAAPQSGIRFGIINTFFPGTITGIEIGSGLQASLIGSTTGRIALDTLADVSLTNWNHQTLPAGRIPSTTHVWYTFTDNTEVTRQLPSETGLAAGWHAYFSNDSTNTNFIIQGNFRGDLSSITVRYGRGVEISYNGTIFLEGPQRQESTVSSFAEWQNNPLIPGMSYSTRAGIAFTAGQNIFNMEATGITADTINRLINVRSPSNYTIDIPTLASENRGDIPVNDGFAFFNETSGGTLTIRPRSIDEIRLGSVNYTATNSMILAGGASVTLVRTNDNLWTVTVSSGTITRG